MFDLARAGDTTQLRTYLDAGLPANLTNHAGDTLLMLAAYHGHAEAVAALVARGADPNAVNDKGQSPLAGAVFKGEDGVVRVLVESGADPHVGQPSALQAGTRLNIILLGHDAVLAATIFNKPQYVEMFQRQGQNAVPVANAP